MQDLSGRAALVCRRPQRQWRSEWPRSRSCPFPLSVSPPDCGCKDGAGRGIQDTGLSAQDPVGAGRPYLLEAAAPMVVGAATILWRRSPLVVNLEDLDAGQVGSDEAHWAGKP